jgi:phosphatidylglycerophosphate synthase
MNARPLPKAPLAAVAVLVTVLLTAGAAPEGTEQGASQAGLIFAIAAVVVVIAVIVYLLTLGRRQLGNRRGSDGNGPGGD